MVRQRRQPREGEAPQHRRGQGSICGRTVTQLSKQVEAPAVRGTVRGEATRAGDSCDELLESEISRNHLGPAAVDRRAVGELSSIIQAPTVRSTLAVERARMAGTQGQLAGVGRGRGEDA